MLCLNKDCKSNDALIIEPLKVIQIETELKINFIIHILSIIDYEILREAAKQIGILDLPLVLPTSDLVEKNESFLRCMQQILLDTHIIEGRLYCAKCDYYYLISNGVIDILHATKRTVIEVNENKESIVICDNNNNSGIIEEDDDILLETKTKTNEFLEEDDEDIDINDQHIIDVD